MSPSDLLATPSSECLQERCSRHRHWETHENFKYLQPTDNMQTCLESIRFHSRHNVTFAMLSEPSVPKQFSSKLCHSAYPPFKLTLDLWTQLCRLIESNEWTSSWQRWPTILSFSQQTNSDAFGTLLRGIPAGTHSSPLSGRTLAGQMPLYPSPGHGDQWVTRTECGP